MVSNMQEIKDNEAKVIVTTKTGGSYYKNSSSAVDIQEAKALKERLCKQIKEYASNNLSEVPTSVDFRYKIGKLLFNLMHSEGVTNTIRKAFLTEIEELTDIESLMGRPLGKAGSDQRHPYLSTCLWLYSNFDETVVKLINWSEWSEIYSRPKIRDDQRIPKWIFSNKKSLTRSTTREVLKAMTYLVEENDLSFMDDEDVFNELDKAFLYEISWISCFEKYFNSDEKKMSAARRNSSTKYKEKYIRGCMDKSMFSIKNEIPGICEEVFKNVYINVN